MKQKNERYFLGKKIAIDVINTKNKDDLMMKEKGLIFMGPEEKNKKAKKDSEEEYTHPIYAHIEFKNEDNLKIAQLAIETLQQAIHQELEEQE